MLLESGDSLEVPSLEERIEAKITLSGHVRAPGIFQWRPGLTLAGVIKSNKDLLPGADTDYVLIKRRDDGNGPISARSVQLGDPSTSQIARSTALHRDDEIIVFHGTNTSDRTTLLEPIIDILRAQATAGRTGTNRIDRWTDPRAWNLSARGWHARCRSHPCRREIGRIRVFEQR